MGALETGARGIRENDAGTLSRTTSNGYEVGGCEDEGRLYINPGLRPRIGLIIIITITISNSSSLQSPLARKLGSTPEHQHQRTELASSQLTYLCDPSSSPLTSTPNHLPQQPPTNKKKMYNFIPALIALLPVASASPLISKRAEAAAAVVPRDAAGCTATSLGDFAWEIQNFVYHASYIFTTPAHQVSGGHVSFNVTNPAFGDAPAATCSGDSSQLQDFFYGWQSFNCTSNFEKVFSTTFSFEHANGDLRLNQTWSCNDQAPQYPTRFTAAGAANITLDCTETVYQNPNWTSGQTYSSRDVRCAPVTVPMKPYEISAVA
ncbi:hypothetical protein B0T17DRAFT_517966 [Bombardia bombarda]|uniref:AA1-like domain-containing protein n=1 Tax=Bombardia bombarda TaxID=252184 RepID=A0AA39XL67_9PEZI|nr:hypothetical protein B0T17DRAFT_517966 [Bombardia bombarda]